MEASNSKRGGKRPNAGRKPTGVTTVPVALKLDKDLYEALQGVENRNRYINEAIRNRLIGEGMLDVTK